MGLKANADGSGAIQVGGSDAITITSGLNTTFAGTATVAGTAVYPLVAGTAQTTTSGTSKDFTGIPSWVDRITIMFNGVSLSASANLLVQGGVGGTIDSTGYASASIGSNGAGSGGVSSSTAGYIMRLAGAGASCSGHMVLTLVGSNIWVSSHSGTYDASTICIVGGGTNTFSGTLDTIRITTTGADTFDAGSVNIMWE